VIHPPPISIVALLPELIILVGGCLVLLVSQSDSERSRRRLPWTALFSLVAALVATLLISSGRVGWLDGAALAGSGLVIGSLVPFVRISTLEVGVLLTLVNWTGGRTKERGEFLAMMLFSLTGLLLVASSDNFLMLFLALELVSIPTYAMVILSRSNPKALEAGTKYFYLGALAAAILAYGLSFLFGVAGTASISDSIQPIMAALRDPTSLAGGLAVVGIVLAIAGLLFKLAAVPLHFYVADVYEGASSPVAGLLGFVPKLAGIVAIFKLVQLTGVWDDPRGPVFWLFWLIAVLSMTVGNILALRQTNIKRMLAYSGVAHGGYMLVGLLAGPNAGSAIDIHSVAMFGDGTAATLYYVVIYGIANLGAFAVLGLLRTRGQPCETLRDVAGLLRREPALALLLALAMLTLMGMPPTPGFWGKLALFSSALTASTAAPAGYAAWVVGLVVVAVLNSALAAAYYLRVVAAALLYESDQPATSTQREGESIGALLCGFLVLIFAIYPTVLFKPSQAATADFRAPGGAIQRPGEVPTARLTPTLASEDQ
jgi:NADH-quinone oxidoreductase subunit N